MTYGEWRLATKDLERASLAAQANNGGSVTHGPDGRWRVHPHLTASSDRATLIRWLVTCDPNGVYTDDDMLSEGFTVMSLDDAWACVENLLADD